MTTMAGGRSKMKATTDLWRLIMSQADDDNHANQCNPNNDAYWESRGEDERPNDWENRSGGRSEEDD